MVEIPKKNIDTTKFPKTRPNNDSLYKKIQAKAI